MLVVAVVVALVLGAAPARAGAVNVYVSNFGAETMSVFASGLGGVLSPVECDPTTFCKTYGFPSAVAIDPTDRHVYVAQGPTNSVAVYAVGAGGTLSPVECDPTTVCKAEKGPYGLAVDPGGGHVYATNTGAASVSVFAIGAGGVLSPVPCDPSTICKTGTNPIAVAVDPSGRHLYVANTTTAGSVSVFAIGAGGVLSPVACDPTTICKTGKNPTAVALDPSGRHLYVMNETDSISVFAIGPGGVLSPVACDPTTVCKTGESPSGIAVDPSGTHLYVSNSKSASVSVFAIGAAGVLSPVACDPATICKAGTSAAALAVDPSGSHLYVANGGGANSVSVFAIVAGGVLSPVPCDPTTVCKTGKSPFFLSLAISPDQGPTAAFAATVGQPGSPSSFNASSSSDSDGRVARFDWNFGDGTSLQNGGATPQHTYATTGSYTASVTVTDDAGCSASQVFTGQTVSCNGGPAASAHAVVTVLREATTTTATTTASNTSPSKKPVLNGVFQTVKTWRLGSRLAHATRKPRPPVGTTFGFTLNEAASVRLTFTQTVAGRRVGHRCVTQMQSNRRKPKCTRTTIAGTLTLAAHAGANRLRFEGRLSRTRRLRPGRYRATITAINPVGQRAVASPLSFTIVKS
jgi:6-phosphogluconolactonase (cycloisomerase 2 family)